MLQAVPVSLDKDVIEVLSLRPSLPPLPPRAHQPRSPVHGQFLSVPKFSATKSPRSQDAHLDTPQDDLSWSLDASNDQPQPRSDSMSKIAAQNAMMSRPHFREELNEKRNSRNKDVRNYAMLVGLTALQSNSVPVECPFCEHRRLTKIEHHSGGVTK